MPRTRQDASHWVDTQSAREDAAPNCRPVAADECNSEQNGTKRTLQNHSLGKIVHTPAQLVETMMFRTKADWEEIEARNAENWRLAARNWTIMLAVILLPLIGSIIYFSGEWAGYRTAKAECEMLRPLSSAPTTSTH